MNIDAVMHIVLLVVICLALGFYLKRKFSAFSSIPLLNRGEAQLYVLLKNQLPAGFDLAPQVSYGEFLNSNSRASYYTINSRRADLVVFDNTFKVTAVIEYQGTGHNGSTKRSQRLASRGDQDKRKALKSAGIPLFEIPAKFTQNDITHVLRILK